MSNSLPTNGGRIINLLTKMYNGVVKYGTAIGVTMVTAPQLLTGKNAFKSADTNFNTGRNTLRDAYRVFMPAMATLTAWLGVVRTVLAGRLGQRWSAAWAEAGFINNVTSIPSDNDKRIALGLALETYFTSHPDYEVPTMDVTAAKAGDLTTAAVGGQTGVRGAEEALKQSNDIREPARKTALGLMSTLIANLDKKLAPDDPRWLAFGLEMPATPTTPGQVPNVTVTLDEMGTLLVQGDAVPLATRYRGRMMILGVDAKYRLVFSGTTPMGTITGVQPGVTVQIIMQAVNENSQGVASEPVIFTVPVVSDAQKTESAVKAADVAPLAPATLPNGNGNGSTSGSYAGSRLS
ncbi:MAG: hypothetical protein H0X40_14195 [Chthoniobacterales bacterium]|nr:hypothetical protein [Chthoniobacterales bacterium]